MTKKCTTGSIVDQAKRLQAENTKLIARREKHREKCDALVALRNAAQRQAREADEKRRLAERMAAIWRLYAKRLETHVKGPTISAERAFVRGNADAVPVADHEAWMGKMR